jgi:fluoroacetyl-CoA thioesterase
MRESMTAGVALERTHLVTPEMSPAHLDRLVLSTPAMVNLIEITCLEAAAAHLDDGETTVGTHICISHLLPADAGDEIVVTSRLVEVDRRRLNFQVQVDGPRGRLSEGTHQRAVVAQNYVDATRAAD